MKKRGSRLRHEIHQKAGGDEKRSAICRTALRSTNRTDGIPRPSLIRIFAGGMLLIIGTLVAYLPTFQGDFFPFDDQEYVYLNSNVSEGIHWDSIIWAFTRVSVANWHPLTWLSHILDVELFGLDPRGHHASSIAWHVANVVLLFAVMKYLTGQALPSFCLAALFALHPTHVEVVGWVAQRKTLISTFFILLTIAAYATYVRQRSWSWYTISLLTFALSLMSKQTFVTLPALLVLLDFWPLRRGLANGTMPPSQHGEKEAVDVSGSIEQRLNFTWIELIRDAVRQLPDKVPFALMAVLAALITIVSQTNAIQTMDVFPAHLRLGNVFISYCRYLAGIFWPSELSIYYPIHWHSITPTSVISSILLVGTVSILVCWNAGRRPYLLTGWFWFLISMLPVIGIVHVGAQSMADRYLYNASFGVFLAGVWLAAEVLTDRMQKLDQKRTLLKTVKVAVWAVVLILGAAISVTTYRRCVRWQTELGPFYEAIDHDPTNWMAHLIIAEKLLEQGQFESAIEHTQAVTQDDSRFFVLHAFACRELGRDAEARELLNRAIELSPDNALALSMLAVIHAEIGQAVEADTFLEQAEQKLVLPVSQLQPRTPPIVLRNCGIALVKLNRPLEAIQRFEAAVQLDRRNLDLVRDLAKAEIQAGHIESAIDRIQAVLVDAPKDSDSYTLLGSAFKQIARPVDAELNLRRALEIVPADPQASLLLADILLHSGRIAEAENALRVCLNHLQSTSVTKDTQHWKGELNSQLGDVSLANKDLAGAVGHYRAAVEFAPDQFSANNNLAWLLATEPDPAIRDPEEAVRLAERANALPGGQEKGSLGTLAAAYAAAGRMEEAIQMAEQALSMAEAKGDTTSAAQLREQLELHRHGKPFVKSVLNSVND